MKANASSGLLSSNRWLAIRCELSSQCSSNLFLNSFNDEASIPWLVKLFQSFTTLCEKLLLLLITAWWLNTLWECPLRIRCKNVSKFNLTNPFLILYIQIMSPLLRRYAKDGSPNCIKRSSYDLSPIPAISFVARHFHKSFLESGISEISWS